MSPSNTIHFPEDRVNTSTGNEKTAHYLNPWVSEAASICCIPILTAALSTKGNNARPPQAFL